MPFVSLQDRRWAQSAYRGDASAWQLLRPPTSEKQLVYRRALLHAECQTLLGTYVRRVPPPEQPDYLAKLHIALLGAMDRFDPQRGFQFNTYADGWLRRVPRYTPAAPQAPPPAPLALRREQVVEAIVQLQAQGTPFPTPEDIAAALGCTVVEVHRAILVSRPTLTPLSLDAPLGTDDEADALGERLESEDSTVLYNHIVAVESLPEDQKRVVTLKQEHPDWIQADIAAEAGMSQPQVSKTLDAAYENYMKPGEVK